MSLNQLVQSAAIYATYLRLRDVRRSAKSVENAGDNPTDAMRILPRCIYRTASRHAGLQKGPTTASIVTIWILKDVMFRDKERAMAQALLLLGMVVVSFSKLLPELKDGLNTEEQMLGKIPRIIHQIFLDGEEQYQNAFQPAMVGSGTEME
eukprot:jgi/Botrbrau1/11343/Bobra.0038s0100.2